MIEPGQIDAKIEALLDHLESIQHEDGSFDTMYLQPHYHPDKGWMKFPGNAPYETANSLVPLLYIDSQKSKAIQQKGCRFLVQESLDLRLWTYSYLSDEYWVPYDTDSTSLSSLVLSKNGYVIQNKNFLNTCINEENNYVFYIWPKRISRHLPLLTSLKMWRRNRKVRHCRSILDDGMRVTDWEFSSTCVNLLYMGRMEANQKVWETVQKTFREGTIDYLYYIDLFHSFYFYARLAGYGNHRELIPDTAILSRYLSQLYHQLRGNDLSFKRVLFANALLFLGCDLKGHEALIEACFAAIAAGDFKENTPFYASNMNTDVQPETGEPHTYFGSPAITCSLYIEFLNLYRKRFHGAYMQKDPIK